RVLSRDFECMRLRRLVRAPRLRSFASLGMTVASVSRTACRLWAAASESRPVRKSDELAQSATEIALAMAIMAAVLALAIFVVVPRVRPGESTSQRDAYIRAVATQQAGAYVASVATQRAAGTI